MFHHRLVTHERHFACASLFSCNSSRQRRRRTGTLLTWYQVLYLRANTRVQGPKSQAFPKRDGRTDAVSYIFNKCSLLCCDCYETLSGGDFFLLQIDPDTCTESFYTNPNYENVGSLRKAGPSGRPAQPHPRKPATTARAQRTPGEAPSSAPFCDLFEQSIAGMVCDISAYKLHHTMLTLQVCWWQVIVGRRWGSTGESLQPPAGGTALR